MIRLKEYKKQEVGTKAPQYPYFCIRIIPLSHTVVKLKFPFCSVPRRHPTPSH
jgi:hypothetical protein